MSVQPAPPNTLTVKPISTDHNNDYPHSDSRITNHERLIMNCTVLPDGSAFATASYPPPKDHWLYAPREYAPGAEEPLELPAAILTHAHRATVVAAIRYAVRGATMCGQEPDFDPDALVQNAVYALCGPFVRAECAAQSLDSHPLST